MIKRPRYLILSLIVALALPISGFAVDTIDDPDCPKKSKNKEDSVHIYEDDIKVNDNMVIAPAKSNDSFEQSLVKEEIDYTPYESKSMQSEKVDAEVDQTSAMSFNFIYYIIDKFKFDDPLD